MNDVIATVGLNPLPVLAALVHLAPKNVHFIVSKQTDDLVPRLQQAYEKLQSCGLNVPGPAVPVDPFDVPAILDATQELPWGASDLVYGGGTAAMSAAAFQRWSEARDGGKHVAWYVAADGNLRNDRGDAVLPHMPGSLSLRALVSLHGFESRLTAFDDGLPDSDEFNLEHFQGCARRQDGGPWERAVGRIVQMAAVTQVAAQTCKCKPELPGVGDAQDVDVVHVRGLTAWALSCKSNLNRAKYLSAAAEIRTRATQIGGSLARAAVVALTRRGAALGIEGEGVRDVRCFTFEDVEDVYVACTKGDANDVRQTAIGHWLEL